MYGATLSVAILAASLVMQGDSYVIPKSSLMISKSKKDSVVLKGSVLDAISGNIPTVASAVAVSGVIAFHEAGHFFAAKWQGMKVQSFNIGYGPKLFAFNDTNTNTEFALRAIPLGGYVAFPSNVELDKETGEIIEELDDPDLLQNRPPLQRALVISAGVLANVLLTFLLSSSIAITTGLNTPIYNAGLTVTSTAGVDAPAVKAGIKLNDILVSLEGKELPGGETLVESFISEIRTHPDTPLDIGVMRDGKVIHATVTPVKNLSGKPSIGLGINSRVKSVNTKVASNPIEAAEMGGSQTLKLITLTWNAFSRAASNGFTGAEVGGPISVVQTGAKMAEMSPTALIGFGASLSINLAILNSLPFPALDGGQLTFVVLELLSGRPVPRGLKDNLTGAAFAILLIFSASTIFGDITKNLPTFEMR